MSAYVSENGDQIIATFSEEIGPPPVLREISELVDVDLGLFYAAVMTVWDDGFLVLVRFGDLSGTQLTLSLDSTIYTDMSVRLEYGNVFAQDARGLFLDDAGNALRFFRSQDVTNTSTVERPDDAKRYVILVRDYGLVVDEGRSGTYTLKLIEEPTADTTVTISAYPKNSPVRICPSVI